MANPRQDERNPAQAAQDTMRRTAAGAEEMRRQAEDAAQRGSETATQLGRSALEASERAARTGTEMMQQNAEVFRRMWQSGFEMASKMGGRSAEDFARVFGLSGDEVRQANEQASRNVDAIVETSTVLTQGFDGISREWFEFARKRIEQNLHRVNELTRCRSPQQFAALQSEILRDNIEDLLHSSRRVAEISAKLAEQATGKMTENLEKARRAA
jgi:phasin family protein